VLVAVCAEQYNRSETTAVWENDLSYTVD